MYNSYNQQPLQPPNRNMFQQQTGFVGQNQQPSNPQVNTGFGQYTQYYVQQPTQQQAQQTGYLQQTPLQVQLQSQQANQAANSQFPNVGGTQTFGQSVNALNPQKTGFYIQQTQQSMEPLKPTATGFVNSFTDNGVNTELKIPLYRLSFITPADQAKFESLFRSFVKKGSNTISGQDCRTVLLRSGLNPSQLARIWALCDTNKAGELLFPEFALAMYLVNRVLQNEPIPYELTSKEKNEVEGFIDAINFSVGTQYSSGRSTPFEDGGSAHGTLQPQNTGFLPQTSFAAPVLQPTGGMAMGSMYMPQSTFGQNVPLQQQQQSSNYSMKPTLQSNSAGPLQSQITGGFQRQISGGLQSQITGGALQQLSGLQSQLTGGMPLRNDVNPVIQNSNSLAQTGGPLKSQITGGMLSQNPTGISGATSGGFPAQFTGPLQGQRTGGVPAQATGSMQTQITSGVNSYSVSSLQPQVTGGMQSSNLQPQLTGPLQVQYTGGLQSAQTTGMPQLSFGQNMPPNQTGIALQPQTTGLNVLGLQSQSTSFLPPSQFTVTVPLTSQKTGFGNNEIYNNTNFTPVMNNVDEDKLTNEESSLFYKIFETYDTEGSGQLHFKVAAEIFRKSGLNRSDLEHIWNLCDTNSSGSLDKHEFALGMHLIYRKLNGHPLPSFLPPNLVPSSTRILDNVKQQLKGASNAVKKQPTRIDGLAYKNNDDDDILPSFRNRRKTSSIDQQQKDENKSIIEQLRRSIDEKSSHLTSTKAQLQQLIEVQKTRDTQALQRVEHLKSQISSLPVQNNELSDVPEDLKLRFESLASRIPTLFNNISHIDDEISNTKVHLYRLRNPSTVIGSGPNGEITESDQKKAKQKALLAARMAALTGSSVDAPSAADLEREEKRYNEEIAMIKEEHGKNRRIIDDIKSSITEISTPVSTAIYGSSESTDAEDPSKEKWELGIGLEPEVFEFLKQLREHAQHAALAQRSQSGYNDGVKRYNYQSHSAASSSTTSGVFNSPSNVFNSASNPTIGESPSRGGAQNAQPSSAFTGYSSPDEVADYSQRSSSQKQEEHRSEDEEDEEERQLIEQLEALKLKRKNQKEARRSKLRPKELVSSDVTGNSSGSWEEEQITSHYHAPAYIENKQTGQAFATDDRFTKNVSHFTQPADSQKTNQVPAGAPTSLDHDVKAGSESKGSFLKKADSSSSNFDLKAAEQQRRVQRGLDDDNGWSDDEPSNNAKEGVKTVPASGESHNVTASVSPVPVAPPLPQILAPSPGSEKRSESTQKEVAIPNHSATGSAMMGAAPEKAVPIAPPLPQIGNNAAISSSPAVPATLGDNHDDDSDVLSIPESVESEDDFRTPEFPNIPPPPPLPY